MRLLRLLALILVAGLGWLGLDYVMAVLPPRTVVIESGPVGGTYHAHAQNYARVLRGHGFDVEIRPTDASLDIAAHIQDPANGIDIGFVGQQVSKAELPDVVSLGVIEFQPLFLFYDIALGELVTPANLRGRRIVTLPETSATARAAREVLALYRIDDSNTEFIYLPLGEAMEMLDTGQADAGAFMLASENSLIHALAINPNLVPFDYREADSIVINLPHLSWATIPLGAFDLTDLVPPAPLELIGAPINVVARADLHPSVVFAMIEAMEATHGNRTAVSAPGTYPEFIGTALPLHEQVRSFNTSGKPLAYRMLPPTPASLVDEFFLLALSVFLVTEIYKTLKYASELLALLLRTSVLRLLVRMERRVARRGRPGLLAGIVVRVADRVLSGEDATTRAKSKLHAVQQQIGVSSERRA